MKGQRIHVLFLLAIMILSGKDECSHLLHFLLKKNQRIFKGKTDSPQASMKQDSFVMWPYLV